MNRKLRSLHRIIGGLVALFLLIFAITGVILNHSSQFKLDQRYINSDWLMAHYGIGKVEADVSFSVGKKTLSKFDTQLFIDAQPITNIDKRLVGAIALDNFIVIATETTLILLTDEGELVESMGAEVGVPVPILNIGTFHNEPVIRSLNGMWMTNSMLNTWEPINSQNIAWSQPYPIPAGLAEELNSYFYGKGISVEQLVLDIHNGRIVGLFGVWLMDILGILMFILAFSGLWMWNRKF